GLSPLGAFVIRTSCSPLRPVGANGVEIGEMGIFLLRNGFFLYLCGEVLLFREQDYATEQYHFHNINQLIATR
ncbi:MAG: hypothetical protein K2M06_00020, partial [Muribaculaceae bacterium]|nr:hypothetical protein [Muribaculaceae bacterium]